MAQQFDFVFKGSETYTPEAQMTDSERHALPEVLDMVDEYENSDEYLIDAISWAMMEEHKAPPRRAGSPRPNAQLDESMAIDEPKIGPPEFNYFTVSAVQTATTQLTTIASTANGRMSPSITTHPTALNKIRPTPNPSSPWYTNNFDPPTTEQHLYNVLNTVYSSCKKWNLDFSPQQFKDYARKAKNMWDTNNPQLRQMCTGLEEMREFLVCGPKDFVLSHAIGTQAFEDLKNLADESIGHIEALRSIDGCGWLDEKARTPLLAIGEQLFELWKERREYKAVKFDALPDIDKLPYNAARMRLNGR